MSDRLIDSKWTWGGVLLLGVGTLAAAGSIALAVYYVRNRSLRVPLSGVPIAAREDQLTSGSKSQGLGGPPFVPYSQGGVDEADFPGILYNELYTKIQKSLHTLFDNKNLYSAFIQYIQVSSRATDRLKALLEHLKQLESALKANRSSPKTASADISTVEKALSRDPTDQLKEIQILVPLIEALLVFPPHIVKNAMKLDAPKRQALVDVILSTPSGVDKHVYIDDKYQKMFNDPDLKPFMTRMGFDIPSSYQTKLTYTAARSNEEDKLSAGLYLLLGTAAPA